MNRFAALRFPKFHSTLISKFVLSSIAVLFSATLVWAFTITGNVTVNSFLIDIGFGNVPGTLTVDNETVTTDTAVFVGSGVGGDGTLTIQNNGIVNVTGASGPDENGHPLSSVVIPLNTGSTGKATVTGAGSALNVNAGINVGTLWDQFNPSAGPSNGLLEIQAGASVTSDGGSIANDGGPTAHPSTGTVNLSGGSSWTITDGLGMGGIGQSGTLSVSGGSTVTVTGPDGNDNPTGSAGIGTNPGGDVRRR